MISKNIIQKIEKEAKLYFKGASGCHDWTHIERVMKLALRIARKEKANLNILKIAILLHDTGRKEEMQKKGKICHAERSAEIAQKILEKYNLPKEAEENILHCIKTHRYRRGMAPETREAKVLSDADKLDSIGAVGIGRAFLFAGFAGSQRLYSGNENRLAKSKKNHSYTKEDSTFLEYEIKLKHIKNQMLTWTGKKIALGRHEFMQEFFKRFWEEVEGKK